MRDIFISHVEENSDLAIDIANALEARGYSTWYYERDSIPGPSYLLQTSREIEESQAVVLVISPHSLGSHQVTKEVIRAHESGKPFIPILDSITHVEFANRQPEWREALGSATSISVPKDGVNAILPRVLGGLTGLGIEPSGTVGPIGPGTYRSDRKRRKPLFRIGSVAIFPLTALISGLLIASVVGGALAFNALRSQEPRLPQTPPAGQQFTFDPGTSTEISTEPEIELEPNAAIQSSLGQLKVVEARLTNEACPPPEIPERCLQAAGNNRYLVVVFEGAEGGDIALTTQFSSEGHSSIVTMDSKQYGTTSVYYDQGGGRVQVVYGVLPAEALTKKLLLRWPENPPLRLPVTGS